LVRIAAPAERHRALPADALLVGKRVGRCFDLLLLVTAGLVPAIHVFPALPQRL
jgi:hypothetical protein